MPDIGYGWSVSGGWTKDGQPSRGPYGEAQRQGTDAPGGGWYDAGGNIVRGGFATTQKQHELVQEAVSRGIPREQAEQIYAGGIIEGAKNERALMGYREQVNRLAIFRQGRFTEKDIVELGIIRDRLGIKAEAPKPEPAKPKAPEPPKPPESEPMEPAPGLTSKERGFSPDPSWKITERNSQGQPTVYTDKTGTRHFSPESTMYKLGYREGGKAKDSAILYETGKTAQGQYRGGLPGEHPFITVSTAQGVKHITQAEAEKLTKLTEEGRFDELQNMGIIPKKDTEGNKIEWRGTEAQQQAKAKDQIKAIEALRKYIGKDRKLDFYNAIEAVRTGDKGVRRALLDLGYKDAEIRNATKESRKNITIGDKSMPINDWNKWGPKYQSIAIKENSFAAAEKAFEADHIKLADGQYMLIKDWNNLAPQYQKIGIRDGFDAILKAQEAEVEGQRKFIASMAPFKIPPSALKEYPSGGAPFEYYETQPESYDLAAALRKGIAPVALMKYFPREAVTEAINLNKKMEKAAKSETLYRETQWRDLRTGNIITQSEYKKLKGKEQDHYVKNLPALVLPMDPKWQELKDRPESDPERGAYLEKWRDKALDAASFAALAATPYTMGAIGKLGRFVLLPEVGGRLTRLGSAAYNTIPRLATSLGKLTVGLTPPAYLAGRAVDEARTAQLQEDWQNFETLSSAEKNIWADKAGYKADYDKLSTEQKALVLLSYSNPPDTTKEEWQKNIGGNLDNLRFYASQKAGWLEHQAPAAISKPISFAGGAAVGVLEGAGYAASIPLLGAMVLAAAPRGNAAQLSKAIGAGMADFFVTQLPLALRANPSLAAGRIAGLFILSPAAALKIGKSGLARMFPRYVPERGMAMEYSTIRLHFENAKEFASLSKQQRMKLTEKAIKELMSGKPEVKIGGSRVTMTIENVPYQKVVGNTLWHFTPDINAFKGATKIKGNLFTSPQAAVRFGVMNAKGEAGGNSGLVEIRVPEGFEPKMIKLLQKGEAEAESVLGKDVTLEPIPGWTGKGISANVKLGAYPIRRFTILGTKTTIKPLGPATLARIRAMAAKEALVDVFMGWHGRMQALKQVFGKDARVSRIENSINKLKAETPETTGKYGEITSIRDSVPHPYGKGTIKPRVTAVVKNSKGEIMLVKDVTEQSFGLPGGQIDVKWKPGQLGFKKLPGGRHAITFEGAAHGQVKSETGIGLDNTRYRDIYLGKVNEHALSGSRIYEANAKTDRFKLKTEEIQDAIWWDGKSEITVYPATYDILKGLAKKYGFDMSKVKIDKSKPVLNKARDKNISKRLIENKPVKEAGIAEINKAEIESLRQQMHDISKGSTPGLSDWITSEGELRSLAEFLHGRRRAVKLAMTAETKAQAEGLLRKARKAKNKREATELKRQAKEIERQAKAEAREAEQRLAEFYDKYGRDAYRPEFYAERYDYWLQRLAQSAAGRTAARQESPRLEELARAYTSEFGRTEPTPKPRTEPETEAERGAYTSEFGRTEPTPKPRTEPETPTGRTPEPPANRTPETPTTRTPETPDTRTPETPEPKPHGKAKPIEEWTPEEIESAVAFKSGVVVHAMKMPYNSSADVTSFHISRLPANLKLMEKMEGEGSAARSARVTAGVAPKSLDIDMGFQDVLVRRAGKNSIRLSFRNDRRQATTGNLTVKKHSRRRRNRIIRG